MIFSYGQHRMQEINLHFFPNLPYFPIFQTGTDKFSVAVANEKKHLASASTCENKFAMSAQLHFHCFLNAAPINEWKEPGQSKLPCQTHKKEGFSQALKYRFLTAEKHEMLLAEMLKVLRWGNQTKSLYISKEGAYLHSYLICQ